MPIFRQATDDDAESIVHLMLESAKDGHFIGLDRYSEPDLMLHFKRFIANAVRPAGEGVLPCSYWVWELDRHIVGFATMSALEPIALQFGFPLTCQELHQFAVAKVYRRQSHGSDFLGALLAHWSGPDIFCRCYPASRLFVGLCKKMKFQVILDQAQDYQTWLYLDRHGSLPSIRRKLRIE
jgi:GNAT superfamily N-acetyltransferase